MFDCDFRAIPVYCLQDYIKNGFDIKLTVAIDYTVSPYYIVCYITL